MRLDQTRVKQRQYGNGLLSRTLEIVKTDGIRIVPGSQFLSGGWVQILLKQRKNILCDRFVFKSEYGHKTAPPVSFDSVVFAVVVITGKMLTIEIRTLAMCGFDLCRGEQKFLSTHPGNTIIRYRKKVQC